MTSASYAVRRNQNLYRQRSQVKLGPVSGSFVIIIAISVLALLYLNQITKTNVFGYQVTSLQQKASQLASAKQDLQVEAARLQSIQAVQQAKVVSGMVPEGSVTYAK